MKCSTVRTFLQMQALGEADDALRPCVRDHLERCPACREAAGEFEQIAADLRATLRTHSAPPDFLPRLVSAARAEITATRPRPLFRLRPRIAFAAAAGLLLALGLGITLLTLRRKASAPDLTDRGTLRHALWFIDGTRPDPMNSARRPILRGSRIYLVRLDTHGRTRVAAVNAGTGALAWEVAVPAVDSLAASADRVLTVSHPAGSPAVLQALNARDGARLWESEIPGPAAPSEPAVLEGRVFLAAGPAVIAVDTDTGTRLWKHTFPDGESPGAPVSAGGRLFAASTGRLRRLDPASGRALHEKVLEAGPSRLAGVRLAVGPDALCLARRKTGSPRHELLCFDLAADLALRWRRDVGALADLLVGEKRVYLRADGVQALTLATGGPLWSSAAAGCGALTCDSGRLYYVDMTGGGRMVVADAATGAERCSWIRIESCSGLAVSDRRAFLNTRAGQLVAIDLGPPPPNVRTPG
jgi:outer membrane protein assembly factor BamB